MNNSTGSQQLKDAVTKYNNLVTDFCLNNDIDTNKLKISGMDGVGSPIFNPYNELEYLKYIDKSSKDQGFLQSLNTCVDDMKEAVGIIDDEKTNQLFTDLGGNKNPDPSTGSVDQIAIDAASASADAANDAASKKVDEIEAAAISDEKDELSAILGGDAQAANVMLYSSWDPRLKRFDAFLLEDDNTNYSVVLPFASNTIASSFSDQTFNTPIALALALLENSSSGLPDYALGHINMPNKSTITNATDEGSNTTGVTNYNANTELNGYPNSASIIASNTSEFKYNGNNYGARSILHQYALTKLVGSVGTVIPGKMALNYMYDIRDRRRFYDLSIEQLAGINDTLTISNPTVSNIIKWSNADKWARTPYSYLDFVFNKWFGLIPNNRLITFRRYSIPCLDNLNFDSMYGKIETASKDSEGRNTKDSKVNQKNPNGEGVFTPYATVISYFGGDTGNSLASFMDFTTGTKWKNIESQIHSVLGDEGTNPLMTIDRMFEQGGFGSAENKEINAILNNISKVSSKIMSFGKFALASNGTVGQSEKVMMSTYAAQSDPYEGGPFQNRIIGPVNRIESVKARAAGIEFEQSFTLKVSYVGKSIGGINPKAALLDCLGNAMEMCSPSAVFWGGSHRFEITPHTYPYHDGGWRDNFMEKIYNGRFFGNNGAISIIGSGIKKVATDDDGNFDISKLSGSIGGAVGSVMGAISEGLSKLGSSIGIGGLSDILSSASDLTNGVAEKMGGSEAVNNGKSIFESLSNNLSKMWHDKCLQETTFPSITGMGALLIGEPVGEWHLTIGNPLNPIMVVGNLICSKMQVNWDEELGPDDFPNGFTVTYTIEHGMARDKDAIQSMFNRGYGKFYTLPDYIRLSSDMETHVDAYTGGVSGHVGELHYLNASEIADLASILGVQSSGYKVRQILGGTTLSNHGNPSTTLITKFTPGNTNATMTLNDIRNTVFTSRNNIPVSKARLATRKWGG